MRFVDRSLYKCFLNCSMCGLKLITTFSMVFCSEGGSPSTIV